MIEIQHFLAGILIALLGFIGVTPAQEISLGATPALTVPQGGTGWGNIQGGTLIYGTGSSLRVGTTSTTTATCAGSASCSPFTVIGNSPVTISATGGGGSGTVGTSSQETAGQLPYWTTTNGFPARLGSVATGTVANGTGISVTAGQSIIGSGLTITNTGVTSNVAGDGISVSGATGAVTISNSGKYTISTSSLSTSGLVYVTGTTPTAFSSVATGTVSSSGGITTTSGRSVIGGALSIACDVASNLIPGCLSSADWTTFNAKEAALSFVYPLIRTVNSISFGGLSTSSPWTVGNVAYVTSNNQVSSVATGTVSAGNGISLDSSVRSVLGGSLQITNSGVLSNVAGSGINVSGGTGNVTISTNDRDDIATSTSLTISQIAYYTKTGGLTTLDGVSTTTASCSGNTSCPPFTVIGNSPITISSSGGVDAFEIATTSDISTSQLAFFNKTTGRTTLAGVPTTTLAAGSNISFSGGTPVILGSSPITINATGGGSGNMSGWATTTTAGQLLLYPVNASTTDVLFGTSATTTAPFWWDVSATTSYIGTGGMGSSTVQLGRSGFEWLMGYDGSDNSFKISSSTVDLGFSVSNALTIAKNTLNATFAGLITAPAVSTTNATTTNLHITGLSLGGLGVTSTGKVYSSATTTAGTGLTYTGTAFNVNTSQNITTLSNLTSDGVVYTSGANGTLNVDSGALDVARGGTGATSLNDLITLATHTTGNFIATITGTANQVSVSGSGLENAGVTLSLPAHIIGTGINMLFGSTTNATSTNQEITSKFTFGGVTGTAWTDFCVSITGGAGLCDGVDATGAGGSSAFEVATTSDIGVSQLAYITKTSGLTTIGSVATGTISAGTGISLSATAYALLNSLSIAIDQAANFAWTGIHDFGAAVLEITNGTAPVLDAIGEIALDTTDNQLLIATSTNATVPGVLPVTQRLWGATIASTSADFNNGGRIFMPLQRDGFTIKEIHCTVDNGTSVVINVSNSGGTTDTETVTCTTSATSDTDITSNPTYAAGSLNSLEIGTITGTVDYLTFTVYGVYTRE